MQTRKHTNNRQAPGVTFLRLPVVAGANLGEGRFLIWQSARALASPDASADTDVGGEPLPAILAVGK